MNEIELKECPFCGITPPDVSEGNGEYWILCPVCHASSEMFGRPEPAIKAWNTRTPPKQEPNPMLVKDLDGFPNINSSLDTDYKEGYNQAREEIGSLVIPKGK